MRLVKILIGVFSVSAALGSYAAKLEGTFKATKVCPAYKSFTKSHNPGDMKIQPGRRYQIIEENKVNGPWVLVLVPEDANPRRWVARECGEADLADRGGAQKAKAMSVGSGDVCSTANNHDSYVLALTWQAGFCEHFNYSGSKPECDDLNSGKLSITNLTIHGLWPNKASCGINYGNCASSGLSLNKETVKKISPWMPNWYYSSEFGQHEWNKHGSCQGLSDDEYFLLAQKLAEKFDASELGMFIRANMGKHIPVVNMQSRLVSALGADVVRKIELRCVDGKYLNEFWIGLPAVIKVNSPIKDLVSGAKDKKKFAGNCGEIIYIEAPGIK